jgi:hypothetical protein
MTALPAGEGPSDAGVDLNDNDLDKVFECQKVVAVACVQRYAGGEGRRCDEQVYGAGASGSAFADRDSSEDAAIGAGEICIGRERIDGCLGSLEPVLPAPSLLGVACGVRTGGEFSNDQGTHCLPRWG